jgi:hypothetical protein
LWAVRGNGSSKNQQKQNYKKSMSKASSKNFGKNFDVSFSSTFFGFIAFSDVFQRWEFKNTTKNVLQKNRVEKILHQKFGQNPKLTSSRFLFITFLGVSR